MAKAIAISHCAMNAAGVGGRYEITNDRLQQLMEEDVEGVRFIAEDAFKSLPRKVFDRPLGLVRPAKVRAVPPRPVHTGAKVHFQLPVPDSIDYRIEAICPYNGREYRMTLYRTEDDAKAVRFYVNGHEWNAGWHHITTPIRHLHEEHRFAYSMTRGIAVAHLALEARARSKNPDAEITTDLLNDLGIKGNDYSVAKDVYQNVLPYGVFDQPFGVVPPVGVYYPKWALTEAEYAAICKIPIEKRKLKPEAAKQHAKWTEPMEQ